MKNIIRLILILSVFSFPRLLFGQAMGTYEVRCVRVSSFLIGDEGGLGNPDVTWELSMRFLSQGLGTISQLPEQCFHKDEYAALTEYYPGSWYLSSGLYPAPPCGTKVYSELVMSGFEKDFIPNNCDFDIFDDFGRIATTRTVIGWRVDQPDIWYPYEYIVRSADNQPLYKFKFEYKYSISIMDGPLASSLTVGGQALSNILCEGDVYKIRANTFSGNNGYFEWERQVVGTSTWIPVKKGYGLQEISVQATTPGNKYRVRAIANDGWNCLGDPAWQTSLDPPTVIPRSPQVYEIEAIGFPACGTTPTGSIRMLPYNYTPTGIYNITLVSESNSIAPINQSGVDLLSVVVFDNLPPDYYTIKISRPNGPPDSITGQCTGIREHILVRSTAIPTPQSVTVEQDQQCFGVNDGQIRVVPQSNPSPYFELDSITLIGPVTRVAYAYRDPRVIGGLPPGTYSVVVSRNGCSSSAANVTINSVTSPLTANISSVSPLCAGERGQITVSGISGGTPFPGGEYKILYVGGEITMVSSAIQYNDLYPRPYTIRIFDANNCMLTLNATITPPPAGPMVSLSVTNATSCMPAGQIVAAGSGGVDPYLFSKDGGMTWQASTTFSNLLPGNYTILIQDASMCESSANATVTTPNFLSITPNQTMTPCADSATAQISTNQSGGNQSAPYLLELFEQANLTTPIQTMTTSAFLVYWDSLSAGTYVVRVTDMDNCTAESTILVKELPQAYFVNVFDPSPECFDDPLPPIEVEVSGRSQSAPTVTFLEVSIDGGPFQFANATSDNGVTSFHEFTPGMLDGNFIFKDQQGCPIDSLRTFDRTRPDSIGIHIISVDSASCAGVFDGSITFAVIGVVKPYKVELITPDAYFGALVAEIASTSEDTLTFSNLGANVGLFDSYEGIWFGGYYLRVTDNLQNPNTTCQAQTSDSPPTNLYAPAELNVNGIAQAQLLDCMGQGGSILAAATGGTSPYEYSLDGVNWQTSTLLSGAVDTNIVFARDVRGCQSVVDSNGAIDTVFIDFAPIPIAINAIYTVQGSECSPQRDSIVLDGIDQGFYVNGFSVSWNTCSGSTIPAANNEKDLINIISIGTNYLVVENLIDNIIPAGCDTVVEGTMLFNLIDSNTCNVEIAVPIKVKNRQPRLSVISKIGVTCSGDMDGSVTVRVIDSLFDAGDAGSFKLSPPFEVTLNNGTPQMVTTTPYETTFIGVSESGFTISVSDANSCSTFIIDSIGRLSPYDLTIVNTPVTGCGEDSTGGLSITVNSGSNLPYMWTWYTDESMTFEPLGPAETLNVSQTTTLSNQPVATLRAIISDNNACVDTLDFNIQGPNILTLLKTDSTNLTCNNSGDGSVSVNFIGGTTPAQYSIDGMAAQSDSFFTGLSAGAHTVVVIDFNGCADSVQFNLTEPSAITINDITTTHVNCFNDLTGRIQITASNGTGALEYAINAGTYQPVGDFSGLAAGFYTITVRDANLCTIDTMNIEVTQPTMLTSSISIADSLTCIQNATLIAAGLGGTAGYNYNWNGGSSLTDTLMNASPGQHIVEITDGLGCLVFDTITLSIPNSPILTLTADTADACNQSNGSFLVNANDGTIPYTYAANGQSNNTGYFSSLASMSYQVIVTDNKGCTDTLSVEIDSVEGPQISQIDSTQTTCAGDNGMITVNVVNGTTPYQYTWSHNAGLNAPVATGLGVGSYQVTATDARLCSVVETINITETAPPILTVSQEVNSACGQDNGMAIVSTAGGNPGYSFSWSHDNTITGPSASNLAAATYLVIVTDQNACKDSVNVVIDEDPPPTLSVADSVDETCGFGNGSITLTSTGINPPYTYTWSHNTGILDSIASNLAAGTYLVTVTDGRNCQDTISVTLENTAGPTASLVTSQNNMCPTGNGLIRVTANGGLAAYTYAWSHDITVTDSVATGLSAGTYTVTVTDQNNCTDTIIQTIVDDNLLDVSVTNVQPTGCDTASGTIEINVVGGQMDYTYVWSHNTALDTNYVDSLSAGNYTVTVTDVLGCEIIGSITVGSATGPTISLLSTTNSFCGPNMGTATLTASGGTLPFTYEWSHNASLTDSFATDLPGGGISVTVRDANNCSSTTNFVIDETSPIVLNLASLQDETCEANNGQITVTRMGGTNPLTYTWSHNAGLNSPVAIDLTSGAYTVSVTDNVGCTDTLTAFVDSIPSPIIQLVSTQNNACEQANGSIVTMIDGGTPVFTYRWSHDTTLNSPMATNLTGASYTVTVTDMLSCMDTLTTIIFDETVLVVSEVSVTPTGCAAPNGSIVSAVAGGIAPYMYQWSHDVGLADSIATGLSAGNYTLVVSDAGGCLDTISFVVPITTSPIMSLNSSQQNDCGQSNGQIIVDVSAGTSPYNYTWSHDATLNDSIASNIMDGLYRVTVTDNNGCFDTLEVVLTCVTTLAITMVDTTDETCGQSNGAISITVDGGTMPYTYTWSHDATLDNPTAANLTAGSYTVTVSDDLNAMITFTYEVTNTPAPILTVNSFINNNCPASGNGAITLEASGGVGPYTFVWSHDATLMDSVAPNLMAGMYTAVITDGNSCRDTVSQIITDEDLLTAVISEVLPTSCAAPSGHIVVTPSLGRSPYTYAWSHDAGLTDSIANNLPSDMYTITVTDVSGCAITMDTMIFFTNSPTLSLVSSMSSSCELANGNASVTATGGTPPYMYVWSHNVNLMDTMASNLAEGNYTVTVTDAAGCSDQLVVNIGGSPAINLSLGASTDETCGLSNGSITLATNGGTAPFNYTWSHDATLNNNVANNLSAGSYAAIVVDMLGCMDTLVVTITNTDGPQLTLASFEDNACLQSNGNISVSASNGTPVYTYSWSHDNSLNDSMATGLTAGTYTVTVVDANNCIDTLSQTIIDQPFLDFLVADSQSTSCTANSGSISLSGSGGQYPYQYTWSHDATLNDSIATNLAVGTYTVTIADSRNCQVILSSNIVQANSPTLTLNASANSSCGLANGSASVGATDGTPPYSYAWSHDAGLMDSVALDLAQGNYTVTVTDAAGCSDQLLVSIGGSPAVILDTSAVVHTTCGLNNGSITVAATGGTAPITYTWSHDNTISSNMASNLPAGDYQIISTDNLGCRDTISVNLTNTNGPMATIFSFSDNTCAQANGSVTVIVNGGTLPYTYLWLHDAAELDSIAQGLVAGTYTVIVSDANGCADTISQTIVDGIFLNVVVSQIDSSNCEPGTGMIQVTAAGGTGAYTYTWSHDANLNSDLANNLAAGNYLVTVTDASGCTVSINAEVPEFAGPTLSDVIVLPTTCAGATGSIQLVPTGGLMPYSYVWSHDGTLNGPLAAGLASGIYEYQVTDARNCIVVGFATIGTSSDIDISLVSATRPACGMADGMLEISITGGAAPYLTQWFNTADLTTVIGTDFVINNLVAGEYLVNVTDVFGCTDQNTYTLLDLDTMNVQLSAIHETCFDADNGSVFATVINGGSAPFTYIWDDGDGTMEPSISPVIAGTYRVTVTDARGCVVTDAVEVLQPSQLTIDTFVLAPGCDDAMSGSIFVNGSGGVSPYIYLWPADGVNGQTRTGLATGIYTLLLIDSTGCQDTFEIDVPDVEDITLTAGDVILPACDGSVGGSLTVEVDGGQTPYMYTWNDSDGQTSKTAVNLLPGQYRVTVTDQGGCMDTLSMVVPDQQGLTIIEIDLKAPLCTSESNGEIEVDVAGGSGNYAYLWDDAMFQSTARAVGLGAGRYIVRVTDVDFGCISRDTFFLTDPNPLVIDSIQSTAISCFGNTDGAAQVFASGGTGNFTYAWNDANSQVVNPAVGLIMGSYQVSVTDENNCTVIGNVDVIEPEEMEVSIIDSMGVSCFNSADGMIKLEVSGGTSPYTIFWPDLNITADSVGGLSGISYDLEITDSRGCMSMQSVQISEPNEISIELIELLNPACNASQAGRITVNATGGTGTLSYLWDDAFAQITPTAFNLDSGTYSVIVTDERMCSDTMTFILTGQSELIVELIDSITPLCFGDQNGSLTISVSGGNDDYVYLWNDPAFQTNANAINLLAGEYILFTSNGDGSCPTNDTIVLGQPELLVSTEPMIEDVNCFGEANGEIVLDVSGGVMPYQINWTEIGLDLGDSVSMLTAGTYHVEIVDNNACVTYDTVTIQEPTELVLTPTHQDPVCFGESNGSISISTMGGVSPYFYQWSAPLVDTSAQINNLSAGTYDVTVIDNNGCNESQTITLMDQSSEINLAIVESLLPSCSGADNGLLSLDATGGSGLFSYQWSNGINGAENDMLLPNIYDVTITDALGCAIDTSFDLSQVIDLELNLGFTDTIICQGQLITIAANPIPGANYSWTGPDGFTSSDSEITVGASGDYTVSVTVSVCSDSETATITNSGEALLAQYILPTQIVAGDTIVILERSWPIPENLTWSFNSDSVIFVGQNLHQWIYTFPYPGQFDIGLSAEIGSCESFISKSITVHADSSTFIVPQSLGEKQILAFNIAPNPSLGFFNVNFELATEKPYDIRIYQINGTSIESRTGFGVGELIENYTLASPANGLYVVSLQSGDETVYSILQIERP